MAKKYLLSDAPIYRYFEEISAIPRASGKEDAIARYIEEIATQHNLLCRRDEHNNVYVKKPGSPGAENLPPLVLQGHTDMVCEKTSASTHDFDQDGLELYLEGDRLRALGTTLGADNGIAVAYMLAVLTEPKAVHPPLECVFTSMEEIGLLGANALDTTWLEGRRLLNLDSCPEGGLLIGSAGGLTLELELEVTRVKPAAGSAFLRLSVEGLLGGHSGQDIDKERANACKVIGRVLGNLRRSGVDFAIAHIAGGAQHNAIPRSATAVLCLRPEDIAVAHTAIATATTDLQARYAVSDPGLTVEAQTTSPVDTVLDSLSTEKLLRLLNLLPDGRQAMSPDISWLVTLSLNLGVLRSGNADTSPVNADTSPAVNADTSPANADSISFITSLRAAAAAELTELASVVSELATLLGARCRPGDAYPAWELKPGSPLLSVMQTTYKELRGKEAEIAAVHAGLECAVFAHFFPDMDIVALGPDVGDIHTPDEWLDLPSFGRTYEYLLTVLARLAQ
jgi:dipeptidase D